MKQFTFISLFLYLSSLAVAQGQEPELVVYKSPTCGCCQKWVDYLSDNGINSKTVDLNDLSSIKAKYQVQGRYQSCHTAVSKSGQGSYVFEGHITSNYVKQFLANPPEGAIGLSVPGMPIGSPGMEMGERKDYYQVLQLNSDGTSSIYAHVNQENQ